MSPKHNPQELRKEVDGEKSSVKWPETAVNPGRAIDEFLWRGDPKATPIQRVGLVVYASMFLFVFAVMIVVIVLIVKRDFDWVSFLGVLMMGTLAGVIAFRLLFNVFRH